jgi:hypothetical protein
MLSGFAVMLNAMSAARSNADEPSSAAVGAWVKGQIEDGRLTVEFYDPAKQPKPFPGWTDFEFRLEYRYDYQVQFPQSQSPPKTKNKPQNKKSVPPSSPVMAVIVPTYTKIEVPIKHRMLLPRYLESDAWHEKGLARHELDHVRVGLHPRLPMLGKHLLRKLSRIEGKVGMPTDANREWVDKQMTAEITLRRDAIQALVAAINSKIDKVTNHGVIPLPDAEEFLANLYLKENLDEMKFAYLPQVLDLIGTREYLQARLTIPEAAADRPERQKK